jgi:adenylyltransferase/sulfurtransferase
VFLPGVPPCYECTLGEIDWDILNRRMSCNLLLLEEDTQGKVATTPTISSIIAGLQVQEAVKLLHGLPVLAGKGFIFEGLNHTSYRVEYTENRDCLSHYTFSEIVPLACSSRMMTLDQLLERARKDLDTSEITLEFSRDIIHKFVCPGCGREDDVFSAVGTVPYARGRCPADGQMRAVVTAHSYSGTEPFGGRTLDQLGLPIFDVFLARTGEREIAYLMAGDEGVVLGQLAAGAAG